MKGKGKKSNTAAIEYVNLISDQGTFVHFSKSNTSSILICATNSVQAFAIIYTMNLFKNILKSSDKSHFEKYGLKHMYDNWYVSVDNSFKHKKNGGSGQLWNQDMSIFCSSLVIKDPNGKPVKSQDLLDSLSTKFNEKPKKQQFRDLVIWSFKQIEKQDDVYHLKGVKIINNTMASIVITFNHSEEKNLVLQIFDSITYKYV